MTRRIRSATGLLLVAGILVAIFACRVPGQTPGNDKPATARQFRPSWQVGEQWVVETTAIQQQNRDYKKQRDDPPPVQWQFRVADVQKLAGRDCYRIEVTCQIQDREQPTTKLWIDQETLTLRQMQTQLPVPGGFRTVTESYEFTENKPAPVLGPLTALPIDLPVFPDQAIGRQAKSLSTFEFEAVSGPAGTKAVGDVTFAVPVEQSFQVTPVSGVKGLLDDSVEKSIGQSALAEVYLKGAGREVRQLWKERMPWPVYSENGATRARLLSHRKANEPNN
jgi:hypothetical protein